MQGLSLAVRLSACSTVIDVIGHVFTYFCQFEKFLFDKIVFGLLGELLIFDRLFYYSPVSNIGDIWSLEEGADESSIVLDIDEVGLNAFLQQFV